MNSKQVFALTILLLTAGCSMESGLSQKDMESLLSDAKVEAAANQYGEAEKKLLQCVQHSDKKSYLRLAALNQLVDVELKLRKNSKAKFLIKEAGADGEAITRAGEEHSNSTDEQLLEQARIAIIRWADSYADVGSFDSARTLYRKAQIIEQRSSAKIQPEDSAESRLNKLAEIARGEKHAIDYADGLDDKSDPLYVARMQRTSDRKKLMGELKQLNLEMMRKPRKELADNMLTFLPRVRTAFGIREIEYRSALNITILHSFRHGQRDKALTILKEDMAAFDNIDQAGIDRADPTTLENANFLLTDLAQYAELMTQIDKQKEAGELAHQGIKLAEQVHHGDSPEYAECFRVAAWVKERQEERSEAIPLRKKQIAMLKRLNMTDNFPPFYESHLELGRSLGAIGQYKEGLQSLDYSIARLKVNQPDDIILAYALTAKADILRITGDNVGARQCLESARPLWETKGNLDQKFSSYRVLSKVLRETNCLKEAHQIALKALHDCDKFPPERKTRELADCYHELALTEDQLGKRDEAIADLKKAIQYQRKARGENDLHHAGMLNFLATMETQKGNITEAEKLRLHALAVCRMAKGTKRSPLVSTLLQIANFYHKLNQPEKAEKYYRELIEVGQGLKDADGIHYVRIGRIQLGQLLRTKNRPEAEKVKDEALAKAPSSLNGIPSHDCSAYEALGDLCLNLQDYENGEKCYDQAEKIALANKPALKDLEISILTRKRQLYKVTKREKLGQAVAERLDRLQKPSGGH